MPRSLWPLTWLLLFRPTPRARAFEPWRHFLLRRFGAVVQPGARIYPSAWIEQPWACFFGAGCLVGERANLIGRVMVDDGAAVSHEAWVENARLRPRSWVAARAYVGPMQADDEPIVIGEGAVIGAAAVVFEDMPPWAVVVGNPARVVSHRTLEN